MDDEQIRQIIATLEEGAGTAEGKSRLSWPDDQACLTANKVGLLRLACSLLRAANEPIPADDCRSKPIWVDSNLDQIVEDDKCDIILGPVDRMETWPEPREAIRKRVRSGLWKYRIQSLGCALVAAILIAIFATGLVTTWRAIFGV
jgi:hypothetical protein